jgi:hypothetical protein
LHLPPENAGTSFHTSFCQLNVLLLQIYSGNVTLESAECRFELHQLFKIVRETRDINQKVLITALGKSQPSLSTHKKNGTAPLSKETLKKIAPLTGINPEYVSDRTRNPFASVNPFKMFLVENIMGKIDYDFIRFLYAANCGKLSGAVKRIFWD